MSPGEPRDMEGPTSWPHSEELVHTAQLCGDLWRSPEPGPPLQPGLGGSREAMLCEILSLF